MRKSNLLFGKQLKKKMKIKQENKEDQNTKLEDIDILKNPTTETLPFRYVLASHWCKNNHVLDTSMGQGYGSYILKGLGAITVTGFDCNCLPKLCQLTAWRHNV